uniref:Zinc finger GRF-type domain-containing protein n=1 Tax=Lactuca sativa TaxID=4236 RepID=A0A9R1X0C3_LACSA|nr:hypothetical protein LSAT_V11C800393180 [Lactuca sativa]
MGKLHRWFLVHMPENVFNPYFHLTRTVPRCYLSCTITMIDIKCNCGATVVICTSYSKRNPGKLYYACTVKDCDYMAFRMKLEEQNRKLKLYLVISWVFFFVSVLISKV